MPDKEAILKDLKAARAKYSELLAKAVEMKIPGILDKLQAWCNKGTECAAGDTGIKAITRPK